MPLLLFALSHLRLALGNTCSRTGMTIYQWLVARLAIPQLKLALKALLLSLGAAGSLHPAHIAQPCSRKLPEKGYLPEVREN